MIVRRCDRCQCYYENTDNNYLLRFGDVDHKGKQTGGQWKVDLCEHCKKEFLAFITREEPTNETA